MESIDTASNKKKRQYNFMCEDELIEKLQKVAEIESEKTMFDVTVSSVIRKALVETVRKYGL